MWCVYVCLVKLQTLKHNIYHSCAALSTPLALRESSPRHEGRADCEARHFSSTGANPGETLYVIVPKLVENEVIVAGSLALVFDINLKVTGAHANNYLVQNVSRALVERLTVKFASTIIQDTVGYDIYKIFEDLFLSSDERENMLREGIQSDKLSKIRSGAGDKPTSSVASENALNAVYGTKYRINLDHPILTDHGVFYPQALYNDLVFDLTLAPAGQV